MSFSERMGIVTKRTELQSDWMSPELQISLWNALDEAIWKTGGFTHLQHGSPKIMLYSQQLWFHFFRKPTDERPFGGYQVLQEIRKWFFDAPWYAVYDFIEFTLGLCSSYSYKRVRPLLSEILQRELSGYTIIDDRIVPITDQNEIDEVTEAIDQSPYAGARTHLRQALKHMSDRENPDYRNSVKESVSAVESAARELTGNTKATLGEALSAMERAGEIHGALKAGFSALYGYTSDADGIRHGMVGQNELSVADAKYFLVACAAFVNYLAAKHAAIPR